MVTNPYRTGSKMHRIFNLMSDGEPRTLEDITKWTYNLDLIMSSALYRRRVASALRTIRKRDDVSVEFNGIEYQLVERS